MRHLAMWTLILFVITSALTVGAMAYGRSRPDDNPLKALGFGVCEAKPCFMGITPGITKWDEIKPHLKEEMGGLFSMGDINLGSAFSLADVNRGNAIVSTTDKSRVTWIDISYSDVGYFPIKYFIGLYGIPCAVGRYKLQPVQPRAILTFQYPTVSITTVFMFRPHDRLNADLRVENVSMIDPTIGANEVKDLCKHDQELTVVPWLGFTTLDRYNLN